MISKYVIFRSIPGFFPILPYSEYRELMNFYSFIIFPILNNTTDIITFGFMFFLLWKLNRNKIGNLFIISGGIWTFYSLFDLIVQLAFIAPEYFAAFPDQVVVFSAYLALIGFAFVGLSARIVFVLYGIKKKEKWLVVTAILFAGISIKVILYYFIILISFP
jgi:hypothetical protein